MNYGQSVALFTCNKEHVEICQVHGLSPIPPAPTLVPCMLQSTCHYVCTRKDWHMSMMDMHNEHQFNQRLKHVPNLAQSTCNEDWIVMHATWEAGLGAVFSAMFFSHLCIMHIGTHYVWTGWIWQLVKRMPSNLIMILALIITHFL